MSIDPIYSHDGTHDRLTNCAAPPLIYSHLNRMISGSGRTGAPLTLASISIPVLSSLEQILSIALSDLSKESKLLIDKGAHDVEIAEISCDGRDLRVSLKAEVDLPFQLPFLNLRSVTLISSATTYNQRNNGFYLFGFRIS